MANVKRVIETRPEVFKHRRGAQAIALHTSTQRYAINCIKTISSCT